MISYLLGKVLDKEPNSIVLDVNGVGYQIAITNSVANDTKINANLQLWTYLAVSEKALSLYGFGNKKELEMFKLLMTISGIGPKSAMSISNSASVTTLIDGISSGDAAYLSKISGISKKNAEKIILNLKDKINTSKAITPKTQNQNSVAIDALVTLGYSEREAREAIQGVEKGNNPEKMIRDALKNLSK